MRKRRNYIKKVFYVNLSSSFMVRTKCKRCLGIPSIHFTVKNPNHYLNPRVMINRFKFVTTFCDRMCDDYYMADEPSDITNNGAFKFTPHFKSYHLKLHKNKGVEPFTDYMDMVICNCGITCWVFYDESARNRPEIIQRKARYKYPHKLEY